MPERIGFDRKIRRGWLDLTAEVVRETDDPAAVNAALRQTLAAEFTGDDARRKSLSVLTRIWLRVSAAHRPLRDEALALWPGLTDIERLWLHWGLALLAYPFFRDVAVTVGRFLRLQEIFSTGQVYREIVARWGERTTLQYAVRRVISSLADWKVLVPLAGERGPYAAAPPLTTSHPELPLWLLEAALQAHPAETVPLYDLLRLPELFPFALPLGPGEIHRSPRFLIVREGLDMERVGEKRKGRNTTTVS